MASEDGVLVQTVKLKVLYTFDADYKDNHLARWPHSVEVNTCYIDSTNQIGLVDLSTCLNAVTTSSPELLSRINIDYAIYAFDYSEEDAPLVGQGMLSKHVAQEEQPAQDTEAMVTGRITKGIMGLLAKNAQPTLEVKLRFKPVTFFTSQRTRSGSVGSQEGRIPQWLNGSEVNMTGNMQRPASPLQSSGLETMQRMLSEGGPPRERNSIAGPDGLSYSRPGSRAGTPGLPPSLPQPTRQPSHARRESLNSGYYSGEDNVEEGPTRKRAKISKVDWSNKPNLNIERQSESLRVTASTASSVRLHRPVAINPAINVHNDNLIEEPVRPPTPVAVARAGRPRVRSRKPQSSGLKREQSQPAADTRPTGVIHTDLPDGAVSSPEDAKPRSASSTPANIPSSPPVMLGHQVSTITSPVLPPMLDAQHDSGFMSANLDDVFGDGIDPNFNFDDFVVDRSIDQSHPMKIHANGIDHDQQQQQYAPVFEDANDVEGSQSQQIPAPQKAPILPPPPPRPLSRAQSFTPAGRPGICSPKLAPAPIPRARQIMDEQKARGLPAQLPQSEPGRPLHRSNSWAPDMSDTLMSEAPSMAGDDSKQKSKKKVGKLQTRARLENAIATGEMPPYCDNCGAIETPAWRRAWCKEFHCNWEEVETSLAHGELCWKEPQEFGEDGAITKFRGLKPDKRPGDEEQGWSQVNLCNPCGLWFTKQKCPRPKEKWQKKPKDKRRKKEGFKAPPKPSINPRSDAPTPMSDDSSPADTAGEGEEEENTGEEEPSDSNEPQLPPMPTNMRASSAEPGGREHSNVTSKRPFPRQVHSSPGVGHGSDPEPVEADLTPQPVRRTLFPSPDKNRVKSDPSNNSTIVQMASNIPAFVRRSPRLNKTKDVFPVAGVAGAIAITADGKENVMPDVDLGDMFDEMFDASINDMQLPPLTPVRRSERIQAKTPQRQFGADLSPNVQQGPSSRTPRSKPAAHPVLAALMGTAVKNGSDMTPMTRAIQEAWNGHAGLDMALPKSDGQRKTPKKISPNKHVDFDFPDLPSLKNSSPMATAPLLNFDFSELPTDHLQTDIPDFFSTDAIVPSSPPGFYHFTEAHQGGEFDMDEHTQWGLVPESVDARKESEYPELEEAEINLPKTPRRTPRKIKR